jgi:hypothetical protein
MNLLKLIELVREYSDPAGFWNKQLLLLNAHRKTESFIRKRRNAQAKIKSEKIKYTRSSGRVIANIHRYDRLIEALEISEQHHWANRNALRYLGDVLAHRLLAGHQISALSRGGDAGFLFDKAGIELEIKNAQKFADAGHYVVLNDLTHCLTVSDLTVAGHFGLALVECKMSSRKVSSLPRLSRQSERAWLVRDLLATDRLDASDDKRKELGFQLLPHQFIETNDTNQATMKYLVSEFIEACQLGPTGIRLSSPEPGLVYIVWRSGSSLDSVAEQLPWNPKDTRMFVGMLSERLSGERAYVRPIAMHDIPSPLVQDFMMGEMRLTVLIDIGFVERELASRGIQVGQLQQTEHGGMWRFEKDGDSEVEHMLSPRRLDDVLFGLLSLQSAIDLMAAIARAPIQLPFLEEK